MPEFTIRAERAETATIPVEADTYEEALVKFEITNGVDADGEITRPWKPVSVTNEDGREVWEKPAPGFKIPVQDRDKLNEALRQITDAMRPAVRAYREAAERLRTGPAAGVPDGEVDEEIRKGRD